MTELLKSRKSKAATLVPLALLSAAWTASLAGAESSAVAAHKESSDLPDGGSVPSEAIQAPASVPVPGAIAPAVPDGTADAVISGASASGIPAAALSAYQRSAQIIDAADTTCNVPWELIAAIGRVESNHGQFGGNTLGADGVSTPGVFGPQLNGKNGTQAIMDTDGGQLDQDPVYDRAVGPMQFIPSTWSSVKVDADGDGQRNPQDVDDASLATGVYLCSGKDDLATRSGQEAAVFRYNHSRQYVDLVLRLMEAYSAGDYTAIPSGTYGGTVFSPSYTSTIKALHQQAATRPKKSGTTKSSTKPHAPSSPTSGGTGGGQTPSVTPTIPAAPTDPVGQALQGVGDAVTGVVGGVTQPVAEVIGTLSEALGFCNQQFASIPDPLGLLGPAKAKCAAKVQGMTEQDAAALVPNTLNAILSWLGLAPAQ